VCLWDEIGQKCKRCHESMLVGKVWVKCVGLESWVKSMGNIGKKMGVGKNGYKLNERRVCGGQNQTNPMWGKHWGKCKCRVKLGKKVEVLVSVWGIN